MPLPTPRKGEEKSKFVSRCVSDLSHKGEGKDSSQRVAICHSQYRKAKAGEILHEEEVMAISNLKDGYSTKVEKVDKLKRKPKKKKKDKYRMTVEDGSGTDPTAASI